MDCVRCRKSFPESELIRQGNVAACMECSMELFSPKKGCDPSETNRLSFEALKHAGVGYVENSVDEGEQR